MPWIPIRYRGFYDVPRAILVEHAGATYFLDCAFDEVADDYPDRYRVYRLASDAAATAEGRSWIGLEREGTFIGEVPVTAVRFDLTFRAAVDDALFDVLHAGPSAGAAP